MKTAPQELLKEYVKSQHFSSTAEIMAAMKEMFRDVVQTAMEVELDEELGRERCQRAEVSNTAPNWTIVNKVDKQNYLKNSNSA